MGPKQLYVNDLIDLTIPVNSETVNNSKKSSSISLLEGLKVESALSLHNLDIEEEEENSIKDTCETESDDECSQKSSEYVLLTADNGVMFKKNHEELSDIKTLDDFKKTNSSITSFSNNFEEFLVEFMTNNLQVDNISDERNNVNVRSVSMSNEDTKTELPKRRIHPTTSVGDWDYTKELPKVMKTSIPKDQRLKFPNDTKKISSAIIPTNTNYMDFEVLREINNGIEIENTKILIGRSGFISVHSKTPIQSKSGFDKGVMTSDIETSQIVVTDSGIDRLSLMFPAVSRESLEELFDKCQKDIDWTVGLLLDSGHEMSELYNSLEPIESYSCDDSTFKNLETSDVIETDNQLAEIKKKKKRGGNDLCKYKEMEDKIQSNFVLGENHYSEKMKKHIERKHNIQIGTSTELSSVVSLEDGTLEEEITNTDIIDGSDSEADAVFMLDSDFIFQLQSRFGGLLRPNMIGTMN